MLKVIIIEDEPHGRETLKNLLTDYCEDISILEMCATVHEGIEAIQTHHPDLVFLDIELHTGNGFEILEKVERHDFEVIFTTAFENYAIKAIRFSALDYLLKPIDIAELQEAVQKARDRRRGMDTNRNLINLIRNMNSLQHKTITLSTSEGLEFVDVNDIIKLEASGSYTYFHLKNNRKMLVSKNLKEYETLLSDSHFYRIHHSCVINLNEVEKYVKMEGGYIVMKDGSQASVSQKRKDKFIELMNMRG